MASITDYTACYEPGLDLFSDALDLAEKVNGTLGLTSAGMLVITLNEPYTARDVAASITSDDFPHCYVLPGTDSVLVFDF